MPHHAKLLFDWVGITQDTRQEQLDPLGTSEFPSQRGRAERATQLSAFFWTMSNIAVKSILRHKAWEAVSLLELLRGLVDEIKYLVGLSTIRPGQEAWRTTELPPASQSAQIVMLRETAREMDQLTPSIESIGGVVQSEVIPYVYNFFDLADTIIRQAGEDGIRAEGESGRP